MEDLRAICTWTEGSCKFVLRLAPAAAARLTTEARVAFRQVPRRGLEIGGILLGRVQRREDAAEVWIEGFQVIASEHRLGPSYLLSDSDMARFQSELNKHGPASVGVFRSQTRSEGLTLEASDAALLENAPGLFLMLAPAHGSAAVFARVDEAFRQVHEFALAPLATPHQALRRESGRFEGIERPSPVLAAAGFPVRKRALAIAAAAGFVLGLGSSTLYYSVHRTPGPAEHGAKLIPLSVQPDGASLHVSWNPLAMKGAARAVLHIQDGRSMSDRDLASSEFGSGNAVYLPKSKEVSFRLDVYSLGPDASGSVQIMNYAPPVVAAVPPPVQPPPPPRSAPSIPARPRTPQVSPAPPAEIRAVSQVRAAARVTVEPVKREAPKAQLGVSVRGAKPYGAAILAVRANSPAAKSGLRAGDVVLAVDSQELADQWDLQEKIGQMSPGTTAKLGGIFGGVAREVEVKLGDDSRGDRGETPTGSQPAHDRGIRAAALTSDVRQQLELPPGAGGVVVTSVAPGSGAFEVVLEQGDVIQEVNRRPVAGVTGFAEAMESSAGKPVLLLVNHAGAESVRVIPP